MKILQANPEVSQPPRNPEWRQYPLRRYVKFWNQLCIVDGILCRQYVPHPMSGIVTVPIMPISLRKQALMHTHDIPTAGHQGTDKTLHRLRQEAYWVSMARDVNRYCRECTRCQQSKLTTSPRAPPLCNIPIGKPWEMIAG